MTNKNYILTEKELKELLEKSIQYDIIDNIDLLEEANELQDCDYAKWFDDKIDKELLQYKQVENGIVMPAVKDFYFFLQKILINNLTDGNYVIPTINRVDFILNGQRTQYSNVELWLNVQDDGRTLKVFVDNETQRKD